MVETWFKWFWYVERRLVDFVVSSVDPMGSSQITGGGRRSRKTTRETIKKDLEIKELDRDMIYV
jgi:hypothetical protein